MKKQVSRMCFICRGIYSKNELTRLVKNLNGEIFLDKTGKADGRGAYICSSQKCLDALKRQKILNKAFKCEVPDEVYLSLCKELIRAKL